VADAFPASTIGAVSLALLGAACAFLSPACGRTVPEGSALADAGDAASMIPTNVVDSQVEADIDLGDDAAPATCDGGSYFIVVGDDAGAQVLQGGCSGLAAPALSWALCGEDCTCSHVSGCSDASALDLRFAQGSCGSVEDGGTYLIRSASWTTGGTTASGAWSGSIRFDPFPAPPGPLTGDYSITLLGDGGEGDTLEGTFCIQQ
jgi:hypothetical protein